MPSKALHAPTCVTLFAPVVACGNTQPTAADSSALPESYSSTAPPRMTNPAVAEPITPPPDAQQSYIAGECLPPGSTLEPSETVAPEGETWDVKP